MSEQRLPILWISTISIGSGAEKAARNLLQSYLPQRYVGGGPLTISIQTFSRGSGDSTND